MSKLEAGRTYLTAGGERVVLKDSTDKNGPPFFSCVKGFYIFYDENGRATNAQPGADIVDMVDDAHEPPLDNSSDNLESDTVFRYEELLQAVLKGDTVQWRRPGNSGEWEDLRNRAFAIRMLVSHGENPATQFRLKPQTRDIWGVLYEQTFVTCDDEKVANNLVRLHRRFAPTKKARVLCLTVDEQLNVLSSRSMEPKE